MTRAILWIAFLITIAYCLFQTSFPDLAVWLGLVAMILWMWGCGRYSKSKGYSAVLGVMLGILNVIGLVILAGLPKKKGINSHLVQGGTSPN